MNRSATFPATEPTRLEVERAEFLLWFRYTQVPLRDPAARAVRAASARRPRAVPVPRHSR